MYTFKEALAPEFIMRRCLGYFSVQYLSTIITEVNELLVFSTATSYHNLVSMARSKFCKIFFILLININIYAAFHNSFRTGAILDKRQKMNFRA